MRYLKYLLIAALLTGCSGEEEIIPPADNNGSQNGTDGGGGEEKPNIDNEIPEGYFEVVFTTPTRAAISGDDNRIQDLRYILFKADGEFVKERRIVEPGSGTLTWPLTEVRDTLPVGEYKAVFLGNCEKTLFPYATSGTPENYDDVLSGYESGYSAGRITLPPAEFSDNTEYYMANVDFSNTAPNPYIMLQRIIGQLKLHRNLVDA